MSSDRDLMRLFHRIEELAHVVRWPEERLYLRLEPISDWSPAQHVDHVVRALGVICDAVATLAIGEDEAIHRGGIPNLVGLAVLTTGWIPRGKGKAPATVLPESHPVRQQLREAVYESGERAKALRADATSIDAAVGTLPHPVLGALSAPQWLRFADIHTRHHLAIVADIDRRRAVGALGPLLGDEGEWSAGAETP